MPYAPTPVSISGSTLLGLFSPQGAHLLVFAWTLGSNGWETFVGGRVAFRALRELSQIFSRLKDGGESWWWSEMTGMVSGDGTREEGWTREEEEMVSSTLTSSSFHCL